MLDAQVNYDDIDTGVACYCYGEIEADTNAIDLFTDDTT